MTYIGWDSHDHARGQLDNILVGGLIRIAIASRDRSGMQGVIPGLRLDGEDG
jgi:hypothetical protein